MVEEIIKLKRLSFAKYLITNGNFASENILPFSSTAILNYHDAIEILFDLILEEKGIRNKQLSFIELFNKVNEVLTSENKEPCMLKGSLDKLNQKRVALKHKGLFPSESDIQEARYTTTNIFMELCEKCLSINYHDINLVHLLDESKTKDYLLGINSNDECETTLENLSLAFSYLIRDFEESKRTEFGKSPYSFLIKRQPKYNKLGIDKRDPIAKYAEATNINLQSIENNLKILALGIDFNRYAKFRLYVPTASWLSGGDRFEVNFRGDETSNNNEIEFCKNFIIECALKLQQVNFKVPNEGGIKLWHPRMRV